MADLEKTIEIIFGARDTTAPVIKQLQGGLDSLNDATQPFVEIQKLVLETEAAILGLSVALGGLAIWEAGRLNESMEEIGTLFGATTDQVDLLRGQVEGFAADSTSDIGTITQSMYDAISATGDWEGAINFLGDAEQLAVAGATDLGRATNILTGILNAYGLETTDAQSVSDALFVTVQNGKTTIDELEHALGRVASSAAAGNVPIETLGAAMAALTGSIGSTNISTTFLNALLKELSKPAEGLAAVMGELSLETDGLEPILVRLQEATGGSQKEMNALFGSVEASTAALILARDSAGTFSKTLEEMETKTGRVAEAYNRMSDEFSAVNQKLINNVTLSLNALGQNLLEGYGEVVGGITEVFRSLTGAIDKGAFDPLTDLFAERADEWGELFAAVAKNLPDALAEVNFEELTTAFDRLFDAIGDVFSGFFGNLDLSQPEDLKEALQGVVDAVTSLTNVSRSIIESWEPLITQFGEWARAAIDADAETETLVGTIIKTGTTVNLFSGVLSGTLGVLGNLADVIILLAGAKQLGLLAGSFATVGAAATSFAGVLGATALGGAIVALGASAVVAVSELTGFGDAINSIKLDNDDGTESTRTFGDAIGDMLASMGLIPDEAVKANREMQALLDGLNKTTAATVTLSEKNNELSIEMADVASIAQKYGLDIDELGTYFQNAVNSGETFSDALDKVKAAVNQGKDAVEELGLSTDGLEAEFSKLGPELEGFIKTLQDAGDTPFADTLDEAEQNMEQLAVAINVASQAYGEHSAEVNILKELYREQTEQLDNVDTGMREAADGSIALGEGMGLVVDATEDTKDATKELGDSLTELQKETIETERLLEELASNERIKAMEFSADIRVAEIEAQSREVVAAFESIAVTIESLTQQTTSLIGLWTDASKFDQLQLEQWIERSFEQQEQALEKQSELIDAQIKKIEASIKQLEEGQGLIYVDGTGLDVHLEGLLVEIFRKIQIEASAQGAEFLLGGLTT
jgi:TP901 family phage tail tape measure protein